MSDNDFERLLVGMRSHLMAFAMIRCGRRRADAEDLCQETLLRAWQYRDTFDGRNFKAWIFTIMTNARWSQRRHQKIVDEYVVDLSQRLYDQPAGAFDALLYKQVCNVMDKVLNEEQLEAMWCHALGETYDEIAARTSVAVGTAKSRVGRARARLAAFA